MSDLEGSLEPFCKDPVGSFGGGLGWRHVFVPWCWLRTSLLEAILIKYVRHIPRGGGTMALERWTGKGSSKAGQVSSPAFCAEATTGLHRPGLP